MKRHTIQRIGLLVLVIVVALQPAALRACAVCYGDPDSGMSRGLGWGIVTLLGVVLVVLGGIASFFVYLSRRAAAGGADGGGRLFESTEKA